MRVALEVWGSEYRRIEQACRLADELGLDGFYYGESPHGLNLDCWTVLASLARVTERIRLGPVIANVLPTYRSPLLLARQAATVAAIAPGRCDLRTGVGAAVGFARPWWEPHGVHYPGYNQRLVDLRACLETCRERWDDDGVDVAVTVAATGERAMALAAGHADVWETSFCKPEEYQQRHRHFSTIIDATAPGRRLGCSLEVDGFVATTAAGVDDVLAALRRDRGDSEDLDPVLERALVGTPGEAAEQLRALEAVGVDQVVVALHNPLDPDAITATAEAASIVRGVVAEEDHRERVALAAERVTRAHADSLRRLSE